jgi:hypothetical protein
MGVWSGSHLCVVDELLRPVLFSRHLLSSYSAKHWAGLWGIERCSTVLALEELTV